MQVQQSHPDYLVLHNPSADVFNVAMFVFGICVVPTLIFLKSGHFLLATFCLLALPTLILMFISRLVFKREIWLDRGRNVFEIKSGQIRPRVIVQKQLSDLREAIVQEEHAKRSDGSPGPISFRAAVVFESEGTQDIIPIKEVFGAQPDAENLVDWVNKWLATDIDSPAQQA